MPYVTAVNDAVNVLHVVRDLDGSVHTGSLTGFTVAVLDEAQNSQDSAATWSEPLTGGYLSIAVTPDATGNWMISVTDPATTAQNTTDYFVQCVQDAAGVTPSGTWLTTLANAKERCVIGTADTSQDAYLNNVIARVSDMIESLIGRNVVQATYTEYVDGDGTEWLNLREGPIQSVTSVATADWSSGTVSTDSVAAGTWLSYGEASEGWKLPGRIRSNGSTFNRGRKNWEVVYVGGFSTVPYDLENLALDAVVWWKNFQKDTGTSSRDIGAGTIGFRDWNQFMAMILPRLEPYIDRRAG